MQWCLPEKKKNTCYQPTRTDHSGPDTVQIFSSFQLFQTPVIRGQTSAQVLFSEFQTVHLHSLQPSCMKTVRAWLENLGPLDAWRAET